MRYFSEAKASSEPAAARRTSDNTGVFIGPGDGIGPGGLVTLAEVVELAGQWGEVLEVDEPEGRVVVLVDGEREYIEGVPADATVSVDDVREGRMPADVQGVFWVDTGWVECRDHLDDPSWAAAVGASGRAEGVPLVWGGFQCDACREAAEA